ncbi:hypothetical protein AMES_4865 [Amycolatopsis mediterranei S699]|uniref:Uncharacterized protein n=2 Tax=Amycolatopsis mediterranei TaxID=33910 RepID=A0A0H3D6P8_AMYMU|nr:hypothetical protein [Amycolatopsis mediterranei]ADJ46690.1 hypothetical protein AMED_4924 [Amycolatopsis mediterranei U32]AEK43491.1 hypothetical protein RAM_25065 [Amycolatopsis mediterranei S699]AFO78401.1 hypothetical protein AMES_4865 [Amycolatopsis mediterranei S699]AGT85529.1 hypothetical protein B737_4865 [Amycolatopsis mediterranei RB]KDO11408.1 hypothetical protein DV26_07660 [Amycolatopsis mediterranei]
MGAGVGLEEVARNSASGAYRPAHAQEAAGHRARRRRRTAAGEWLRAWQADTGAHGRLAVAAQQGSELFGPDTAAGARLARMGRFFGGLSEQMSGSTVAEAAGYDALTVVAALGHAGRPLTPDELAAALGWPGERARAALEAIRQRPALADPFALRDGESGTVVLTPRPDRLSLVQRAALEKGSAGLA